ncbi:MAG: response regulator transcription factor [Bacteroidales bacterium]|nr:response regulator transcription factor [Bacteroidales bacterium]
MKILLVEDEKGLSASIQSYLKMSGHICELAADYQSATEKINLYKYDCALIDINLPDGSGLDLIKKLKADNETTGVIIISARDTIDDRIKGLDLGADDYLVKPFDLAELNARIKSLFRRISFSGSNIIEVGELSIYPDEFKVKLGDELFDLTKKEYNLLMFFVSNANRVLAKETIAEHLWGDNIDMADSYDFVYAHIKNLRKKLQEKGLHDYIQTIYGIGYKFQTI